MSDIIIFGGTTEARALLGKLEQSPLEILLCLATDYAEAGFQARPRLRILRERLDQPAMEALFREEKPYLLVDATHPYAQVVSRNLRQAAATLALPYLRVLRPELKLAGTQSFPDMPALVDYLNQSDKSIFSTLGAKELAALTQVHDYQKRIWVRVLPYLPSLQAVVDNGFLPAQTFCLQGPFSQELNRALFAQSQAEILLSKASGKAGGVESKIAAAQDLGMEVLMLSRPREEEGLSWEESLRYIEKFFQLKERGDAD